MASTAFAWNFQPRRGKARLRLGVPAELVTVHGRHRIMLLDLSESGARLQCDAPPVSDGLLKWFGCYEAFGSVVRHSGREVGLKFDQPIDHAWLLDTRQRLSAIARGEDELRCFAREWVRGDERVGPAQASGGRAQALPRLAAIADVRAADWERRAIAMNWLRAGEPFILGGAVVGIIAGYWSSFF